MTRKGGGETNRVGSKEALWSFKDRTEMPRVLRDAVRRIKVTSKTFVIAVIFLFVFCYYFYCDYIFIVVIIVIISIVTIIFFYCFHCYYFYSGSEIFCCFCGLETPRG